jgi:hypothetical protein
MKFLVTIIGALFMAQAALADNSATGPAWTCKLDADVSGFSAGFILNVTDIHGNGNIVCSRPEDQMNVTVPVVVKLGGVGFGFGISKVTDMKVFTLNVGVTDPEDMLGEFNAGLEANFTFLKGGAGVQVGVKGNNGLALDVGLTTKKAKGLHITAGGFAMSVEASGDPIVTPWN